ncbi:MAG TPA: hypothetical protein VMU77_04435 [Acidimicrobiales bacterium]|nr:hypothetical protein [Acidimicrobiales bacterium]
MGLLDKVKEQASQALEKATQAGVAGQAKLDALGAKRKVDALLREIGAAVYRGQTSGEPVEVSSIVEQIQQIEAENGPLVNQPAVDDQAGETEG